MIDSFLESRPEGYRDRPSYLRERSVTPRKENARSRWKTYSRTSYEGGIQQLFFLKLWI